MAINRAPFNALVDDSGNGLTGSIWNKAAIASVLLDPIDALGDGTTVVTTGPSGTVNDYVITGRGANTVWQWVGTGTLNITGIAGGAAGHRLTIKNAGANQAPILIANGSLASASSNRCFNLVTSGPTPIAYLGWATYYHNGNGWSLMAHDQGSFLAVAFDPAMFGSDPGGTWTVAAPDVLSNQYRIVGRSLHWVIGVGGTFSGSAGQLKLTFPSGGYTSGSLNYSLALIEVMDAGVFKAGEAYAIAANPFAYARKFGSAAWTAGAVAVHQNLFWPIT